MQTVLKMKNAYQVRFVFMALLFMALGWLMALSCSGEWTFVFVILIVVVTFVLMRHLVKMANFVPGQVNYFLRSLLCHDYMIHFTESKDMELKDMYENMNRIIAQYRENLLDIHSKQQYYNRLLRIMTHELRNSITPVITLSSDMLRRPENYHPDRLRRGMEVIHGQCKNVKSFLDSYYQLTHLPVPEKEKIELDEFFGRMQELTNDSVIHFSWAKNMTLMADESMLSLVLTNLIKNAREATLDIPDACVHVVASVAAGVPYIQVSDNGPGVPENLREEIFLPFYTTKQEGTGIGLCLSRQMMRQHGGDLKLLPTNAKGAVFIVTF